MKPKRKNVVRSKKENIHVENEDNRRTSRIEREREEDEEIKEGEGGGKGGRKSFLEGERKDEEERRARHT